MSATLDTSFPSIRTLGTFFSVTTTTPFDAVEPKKLKRYNKKKKKEKSEQKNIKQNFFLIKTKPKNVKNRSKKKKNQPK